MNYWQILLHKQKLRGKSGFTIPFIIGCQRFFTNNVDKQNIEQLLVSILSNSKFTITLRYCIDIKEIILEISNPMTPVYFPKYNGMDQRGLSVSTFNTDLGETCESIIRELENRYLFRIINNEFSVQINDSGRDSIWGDYTESEIHFIKDCISNV